MNNIITIKSENWTAKINLSRGANCISLKNSKFSADILREPDYSKELDNPYLYGMPILFPVNRISGGEFEFEGRKYKFPVNELETNCHLHGELHNVPFEAEELGGDFVKCIFKAHYLDFPHRFILSVTYRLTESGLVQETEITNLSNENAPVFLGFHTTFNVPFIKDSKAENVRIFAEVCDEIERNNKFLPTGVVLKPDGVTEKLNGGQFMPFEKRISRHYRAKGNGAIELFDVNKKLKLVYENDEKFGWRLIYNGNIDEYICLEPQNCMVNCMNSPFAGSFSKVDYIKPNSSKNYKSRICLKEVL